ncbi:hypothetical protein QCA50_002652 [Cerrena zonata]|uniref:Aminopeptidase n=1 Tax=Cerrena zonata TaxID=2478898 RepID=A0AAW0GT31_9APHY
MTTPPDLEYRLPTNLKPKHYDLTVRTDLEKLKFDGFVEVTLEVNDETDTITFNTAELTLGSISITSPGNEPYIQPASALCIDKVAERATLKLPFVFSRGSTLHLNIAFEGDVNATRKGYFRSTHKRDGQTSYYAVTQFAPTAARSAFPCWDEPALKATFATTLISRPGTVNLNNMPSVSEVEFDPSIPASSKTDSWLADKLAGASDKWKITKFQTTPLMSTYIVAYANGYFTYLEGSYKSPLSGNVRPLRLYATEDLIDQAEFVMSVKERVLPLYEKVFDIEYPLPKLDTLVVSDFESGAMENWGLIMGSPRTLLVDPKTADVSSKKMVASVESHEIAHMWFGNITTTFWWDHLYLNEGFASLMGEVIILDKIFPEFKVHANFISRHLNNALNLDAKLSSHPIEVECPDANMINQIFDALSYSKAASVLRMLSDYVGEDKFLKGVSIYLKDHLYQNTVTDDLWKGIQAATNLDIPNLMNNWVQKMGFPVVTVTETSGGIHVRQDRFLESGPALPKDNETIWTIPLCLVTAGPDGKPVVDRSVVLDIREKTIPFDTSKPYKLNSGTVGVYRVLYTPERLAVIAKEAAKPQGSLFTFEDRIGLINDSPALAKAGLVQLSSTLTLIDNFRNETEFLVWSSISDCLGMIVSTWWEHENIVNHLNALRKEFFVPIVKRLGYEYSETEDVSVKELRTRAIMQAAEAGNEGVIEELRGRFDHFLKTGDSSRIPADLLNITYKIAGKYGGQAEWDLFASSYTQTTTATIKRASMVGLGAFQEDNYIEQTFGFMETRAKDQDLVYFFMALASNLKYRRYSTRKFKESFDSYFKRVETLFTLQYTIQIPLEVLTTKQDLEETAEFFKGKDTSKYDMTLQQTLDTISSKALWIKRSTDDLLGWFENRQSA